MHDFLLDIALPVLAEFVAVGFFIAVFCLWWGIAVGAI